ncbi:Uncharacterised protein [Vibrio cholerae]|nr:Uncharacterised protein [Vibrio cholerae]
MTKPIIAPIKQTLMMTARIGISPKLGNTLFTLSIDCNKVAEITAARPTWRPADKSVP